MKRLLAILLLLSLFLGGCATSQISYIDGGLGKKAFKTAKKADTQLSLVTLGVSSTLTCDLRGSESRQITSDLDKKLRKKRRNLQILSSRVGAPRTGQNHSGKELSAYFSTNQIRSLRESGADLGLLLVLQSDRDWRDVHESCTTETEHERDKEGNIISSCTTTTYTTQSSATRRNTATYLLFDIQSGERIWQCEAQHQESNSRSSCSEHCYPPPPPHPAPPSIADVVANLSNAAVRKLPQ